MIEAKNKHGAEKLSFKFSVSFPWEIVEFTVSHYSDVCTKYKRGNG